MRRDMGMDTNMTMDAQRLDRRQRDMDADADADANAPAERASNRFANCERERPPGDRRPSFLRRAGSRRLRACAPGASEG